MTIKDNDNSRSYSYKVKRDLLFKSRDIKCEVAVKGRTGESATNTLTLQGVETGDSLRYGGSTRDSLVVLVSDVDSVTVTLASAIPANTEFSIFPPYLRIVYKASNITPGNVVQIVSEYKFGLSATVGRRGWVVSTYPATLLNRREIGVPVALAGAVPCWVSADSGAVGVGDALTAGVNGIAVKAGAGDAVLGYAGKAVSSGLAKVKIVVE